MAVITRGNTVFVLGGQHEAGPTATSDFLSLDLFKPEKGWRVLPSLPVEGIVNCVLTATASELYVFGGVRIEKEANVGFVPPYLDEGWVYREKPDGRKLPIFLIARGRPFAGVVLGRNHFLSAWWSRRFPYAKIAPCL